MGIQHRRLISLGLNRQRTGGRAAKDGSEFTNKAVKESVWTAGNGTKTETKTTNGQTAPVQPLDTFDTDSYTDVSIPQLTDSSPKAAIVKEAAADYHHQP